MALLSSGMFTSKCSVGKAKAHLARIDAGKKEIEWCHGEMHVLGVLVSSCDMVVEKSL